MKECAVDGCKEVQVSKGYCKKHYRIYNKYGNPLTEPKRKVTSMKSSGKVVIIEDVEYKRCNVCDELKELTQYYSSEKESKSKGKYTYYHPECKACAIKRARGWYVSNPEKVKVSSDKYAAKENVKIRRRKRASQAREEGKYKEWQKMNKNKLYNYGLERRMHKEHAISDTEWFECLDFFNNSCAYCGISEGMAFELYGQLLHKEHLEHDGANDITNCVPACKSCNGSKHTFQFNDWFQEGNPVYNKRRYNKIVKWILSFSK
ncbi:HNH endonuclease [Niallia sp. FSL W8-0951]|uniref:HNH endonuclease signature motif containing protein n=1 Tax=Niallia sp. FSL W8-0951 TaxID=2954639 RepID=UPI0030F55B80